MWHNFNSSVRSRSGIGGDRRKRHAGNLLPLPANPWRLDQIRVQATDRGPSDALAQLDEKLLKSAIGAVPIQPDAFRATVCYDTLN